MTDGASHRSSLSCFITRGRSADMWAIGCCWLFLRGASFVAASFAELQQDIIRILGPVDPRVVRMYGWLPAACVSPDAHPSSSRAQPSCILPSFARDLLAYDPDMRASANVLAEQ